MKKSAVFDGNGIWNQLTRGSWDMSDYSNCLR